MKWLEAIDHISQVIMALSIIVFIWQAKEQKRQRRLADPNDPYGKERDE